MAAAVEYDVLGPGDYDRAKRVLNRARHPGFVGRELFFRCATTGQAVIARDGEADLAVALIAKGKLQALSVVCEAQGRGVGAALVAKTAPKWVNAIMERVSWFEKRGYRCVGAPRVGQSGKMATQLMELAGEAPIEARIAELLSGQPPAPPTEPEAPIVLPPEAPIEARIAELLGLLPEDDAHFVSRWRSAARREQLAPGTIGASDPRSIWSTWLILAGRGFGKTRAGAETILEWVQGGRCRRLALVAPTAADARDVIVEGESGVLAVSYADGFPATYESSKRRVTWPNGAIATLFSAEEPDRLRGPQHDGAWCDEIAAWKKPDETWNMLQFGLRLGDSPRAVVTTTPRPIALVRRLIAAPTTVITRGRTRDNAANLAPTFIEEIERQFAGTRLGRQELDGEVLDDNPGALWKLSQIDRLRARNAPELTRVVVAVDPSGGSKEISDEVGIGVAGVAMCTCKRVHDWDKPELHGFVLEDASDILSPGDWAARSAALYHRWKADRLVAETNFGGDMVESNIRTLGDPTISYKAVTASRGKAIRAEPVAALYEQGKVHHVGAHPKLEDEMTQWNPLTDSRSPNRVDWLVWALTELMLEGVQPRWTGGKSGGSRRV